MKRFLSCTSLICLALLFIAGTAAAQDIEYVNSLYWTGIADVKVQGQYAFCCFDAGLVILDISNINEPTFVSRIYFPGDNHSLELANQCAYIFGDYNTLKTIDITDPDNPELLSEIAIDAEVENIWVDAEYIYAAAGRLGMLIIDISDPADPEVISQFDTEGVSTSIVVRGDIAYLAERFVYPLSYPFQVINVIDRYNPELVGFITDEIGWNYDLIIEGDYAYLANSYAGFIIIDISNGTHPIMISQLEDITYPRCLSKLGNYVFMNYGYDSLQVYNVSDPQSPELTAIYDANCGTRNLDILGDHLFIATAGKSLPILDISDLENIHQVSEYETNGSTSHVFKIDQYLYTCEPNLGFRIHNLIDPENPIQVSQYDLPSYYFPQDISDDYLYLFNRSESGIFIIDISDPLQPGEPIFHSLERDYFDICVSEPYIYLPTFNEGIDIYEIISPDSLMFLRNFQTSVFYFDIEVENDIGYLCHVASLDIYDFSNPSDSVLLGSVHPSVGPSNFSVSDGFVYTLSEDGGRNGRTSIIDATDPTNPQNIAELDFPSYAYYNYVCDDLAFYGIYKQGLFAYDVSDPYHPVFVDDYPTPSHSNQIFLDNDYIYIANGSTLLILRFTQTGIEQIAEI
ncbi:MAG: hypothetical protein GY839_12280, partial [candidate division Zixibacteria bacterium]|nr:hypothetical protein [candidate division Zixibacteria bacterium]